MDIFKDFNGATVRLAYEQNAFQKEAKHVITICQYQSEWLLTRHKIRGLEFPGGKVEEGETLEEAAKREVHEETGGLIHTLEFIAEYEVDDKEDTFVKAIFYGDVKEIEKQEHYHETGGPVLVGKNILEKRFGKDYSFIMKDLVIEKSLQVIEKRKSGK